jgi:hypothetical protein
MTKPPTSIATPRAKKNLDLSTRAKERALREAEQRPCRWCDLPEGAPTRCHRCPRLDGDIMPHCWGCIHGDSLATCCCPRVRSPDSNAVLGKELKELRIRVGELECRIMKMEREQAGR